MRSHCPACELALEPYRADDAPAYFTIFAVGHIVVPLVLAVERYGGQPPLVGSCGIVASVSRLFLALILLPRIKGAVICAPVGALDSRSQAFDDRELRPLSLKTWPPPTACAMLRRCWVWKCR